ncbi:MAG: hypothetical protein JXK07_01770 [Spirochaetes bacterium]|nr:hypothetical protein [Spirochaetota bacterium]
MDTDIGIGYIHSSLVDSGAEDSNGESAAGFCKVLQLKDIKAVLYLKNTIDNSNGILTVLTYNKNRKISEKVSSADWNWPSISNFPKNSELIFDDYILLPIDFTESTSKLIVTKNGKMTEICSRPYPVPESKYLLAFASDTIGNYGLQIFDAETGKFVYNTQYEEDAPYFLNYEYNHRAWFADDTILILPCDYETGTIIDQYHIVISLSNPGPEFVSGPYPGSLSGFSELKHN